ncbi:MAG: hypothetical protein KKD18_06705 [Nanoarchaeota archaeon]|nr:hypothetical protein [Nanoarchaeota archaeon]MBU0978082.1 hypothetical protein [Nanoarchaeota archaeon]
MGDPVLEFLDENFPPGDVRKSTCYIPLEQGTEGRDKDIVSRLRRALQEGRGTIIYVAQLEDCYRIIEIER